jgi:hypothetical protein
MTRKLAISVPDDVAERLAQEENVSAFITRAVRRVTAGEEVRRRHRDAGFDIPESEIERARAEHERLMARITPEKRAELEEFSAKVRTRNREFLLGTIGETG